MSVSRSFNKGFFCGKQLTSRDTETSVEVVYDGEDGGIQLKRHPVRGDEAEGRDHDNECCVEPVDVLVEVAPGHGRLGDVHLGGIRSLAYTKRLVIRGAIREGRGLGGRGHRRRHGCL